jgi:hypothetical protein
MCAKIHPLHNVDFIAAVMKDTGRYFPAERGTGRTTVLALQLIAQAIQRPHTWHSAVDHFGTLPANAHLLQVARSMVLELDLKHFHFRQTAVCFGTPPCASSL